MLKMQSLSWSFLFSAACQEDTKSHLEEEFANLFQVTSFEWTQMWLPFNRFALPPGVFRKHPKSEHWGSYFGKVGEWVSFCCWDSIQSTCRQARTANSYFIKISLASAVVVGWWEECVEWSTAQLLQTWGSEDWVRCLSSRRPFSFISVFTT